MCVNEDQNDKSISMKFHKSILTILKNNQSFSLDGNLLPERESQCASCLLQSECSWSPERGTGSKGSIGTPRIHTRAGPLYVPDLC